MNKSKFLKRSLAALLAILMAVAMVPMSALAEETEAFVFPDTITVNNRNAVYDADNNRYNVTVSDTTLASVSWTPVAERKVEITTYRGITETVPYDNLDLLTEAKKIEDNVYELDLTVTDTKANEKHNSTLRITVDVTVPNDDASLQAVRVNQTFSVAGTDYSFNAIKGEFVNDDEIQITLPLGMTADEVGFGGASNSFGGVASAASNNSIVSRVFAPSSAFASVKYADGSDVLTGKVTVTAATGRTQEYTVHYVQEEGLTSVAVNFGDNHTGEVALSERSFDPQGKVATYSAYIEGLSAKPIANAHVTFSKGENVVRVEASGSTWSASASTTDDEPIQSDENTITFTETPTSSGIYVAYLSVKTKANYDDNTASDPAYFKNVKLELRDVATTPVTEDPKLVEFQLNGYEAVYNEGGLGDTITYYVDDAYFTANVGAGTLASRISLRTDGDATVSIPAQTDNGSGDFWKSVPQITETSRLGKPVSGHSYIANVDAGDKSFKVRVAKKPDDNSEGRIYTINLVSVNTNSRNIKTLSLVYKNNKGTHVKGEVYKEATLTSGGVFEFALPDTDFDPTGSVTTPHEDSVLVNAPATAPADGVSLIIDGLVNSSYTDRIKFDADFLNKLRLALDAATDDDEVTTPKSGSQIQLARETVTDADGNSITNINLQYQDSSSSWVTLVSADEDSISNGVLTFGEIGDITFEYVNTGNTDWQTDTGPDFDTIFAAAVSIKNASNTITYTPEVKEVKDGNSVLKDSLLDDFYLVAKTGDGSSSSSNSRTGAVVTPGGTWAGTNTTTTLVGTSAWRPSDSGTIDGTYSDTATCYTELENGVTTLRDLWSVNYLLRKSGTTYVQATGAGRSGDMLVLTVTNRNTSGAANTTAWGVTFKKASQTTTTPPKSEEAELTIKRATSALDEDLIHGGRTVSTFTGLTAVAPNTDAPYIGAIGGHNEYEVDEPKKVPGGPDNAYYIAVHVPEDFGDETGTGTFDASGRKIYLDQIVLSENATVRRDVKGSTNAIVADTPSTTVTWPAKNIVEEFSLDMDDQTKNSSTGNGNDNRTFIITAKNMNAWFNGSPRISEVESDNILYVTSEKDEANPAKRGMNSTRVYYIIPVKDNWEKQNNLSGITSDDVAITGGRYQKVININVPYSYNWSNYRDSDRYDFSLKFGKAGTAVLVDAYRDELHGPFVPITGSMTDPFLGKNKQEVRDIQLTDSSTFFVKDNELWIVDELTGDEVQITGRGNGVKYSDATWGTIVTGEAELHVYNESQSMIDIYRLRLNIQDVSKANEIVSIRVDETPAVKTNDESVWSVDLSNATDVDLSKVALNITVAPTATIESVDGAPYEANVKKYDLNHDIKIVVVAENGDKAEYTLTAGKGGDDPTPPTPDKKPSESYDDLDKVYSGLLEKVETAINMGLMGSISGTSFVFGPKEDVHRKDVAVIIARADLIASNDTIADSTQADEALKAMYTDGEDAFDDLSSCNAIQKAAIRYCAEKEIIGGDGKGKFTPDGDLKREEMAVILTNWTGITVDKNNTTNDEIADWNNVSNWAKPYVNAVYGKMMNGVGNSNFGPKVTVSREQTASMLVDAFGILYPGYGH